MPLLDNIHERTWSGDYDCDLSLDVGEKKWQARDFTAQLPDTDGNLRTIVDYDVRAIAPDGSELTVENEALQGALVSAQLSGSTGATRYNLWYAVQFSDGDISIPDPVLVHSQGKPAK